MVIFTMNAVRCTARVICTIGVAAAALLALVAVGRRSELAVPVSHLGRWLLEGDPATVLVALLRWVAMLGAGWLLVSTLLYVAASVSRVPGAVRAVRWSTVPAVRRAVDAACAVSVAAALVPSVVLAPGVAGAARADDPPSVSIVRDGRGREGGIAVLPPDTTSTTGPTTTTTTTTTPRTVPVVPAAAPPDDPPLPVPPVAAATDEVVIAPGDDLWQLAARRIAGSSGRSPTDVPDHEVAPYWVRVCDANRSRLASGDPNLVFPGERVVLPPV
jgi:hypothetical protein